MVAGMAFKISAVPFHMWTPDVYEGAPTPVTALMGHRAESGRHGLLLRLMSDPVRPPLAQWQQLIILVSIASMLLGAFAAIGQRNIKRLMAYSSIGHMGYALIGLAAGTQEGHPRRADLPAHLRLHERRHLRLHHRHAPQGQNARGVSDLRGLGKTDPGLALALTVFMFSMAGIPPFSGFFGKYFIFAAAVNTGPVDAGGDRRADQRGRRLLLYPHHLEHDFAAARKRSTRGRPRCRSSPRPAGCSPPFSSSSPPRSWPRPTQRRKCCSADADGRRALAAAGFRIRCRRPLTSCARWPRPGNPRGRRCSAAAGARPRQPRRGLLRRRRATCSCPSCYVPAARCGGRAVVAARRPRGRRSRCRAAPRSRFPHPEMAERPAAERRETRRH